MSLYIHSDRSPPTLFGTEVLKIPPETYSAFETGTIEKESSGKIPRKRNVVKSSLKC